MWHCGVVVITTAQLHLTKPEIRFCAGSNPGCSVSKIRDGEDLWQWSRLEIRLSAFRRSTISQKQFIIIIIIIIIIIAAIDSNQVAEILKYYESVKNKLFCMAKAMQTIIYQLWQKSFRILIVTILLILWSYWSIFCLFWRTCSIFWARFYPIWLI